MSVRRWLGVAVPLAALAATVATAGATIPEPPDWDGDGAVATDCKPLDPAVHPGVIDKPDTTFEDTDCDGIDGDADGAYFVATTGNNSNPGTRTQPLATIQEAIIRARTTPKDIYVAAGTYARTDIADADDGVEIYGGYVAATWARNRTSTTTISGSPYALSLTNALDVVVQLVSVTSTADTNKSAYGIRTTGSELALLEPTISLRAGRRRHARHARGERARRRGRRRRDHRPAHRRQLRHAGCRRGQRQARDRPDHHGARRQRRDRRRGDQRRGERRQRWDRPQRRRRGDRRRRRRRRARYAERSAQPAS